MRVSAAGLGPGRIRLLVFEDRISLDGCGLVFHVADMRCISDMDCLLESTNETNLEELDLSDLIADTVHIRDEFDGTDNGFD